MTAEERLIADYERLFVSRPQHVEAVQWDNTDEAVDRLWAHTHGKIQVRFGDRPGDAGDRTLYLEAGALGAQGLVPVPVGHWVVHPPGDVSDIWPVEDAYFRAKYQPAHNDGSPSPKEEV